MSASRHTHLAIGDLLDILPDAVVMVDAFGNVSFVNPAVRSLLGYTPMEILGQPLSRLVPPDARERHETLVSEFRRDGGTRMMGARPVLHAVHRSGRLVPVSISLCNLVVDDGERVSVAVIHDVSSHNTRLDRAIAHAETDALTGVGNRLRLSRRLQALIGGTGPFSLLWLKLVDLQRLTDDHGAEIGDDAVRIVARRLQAQLRRADALVHLGSDEFVMLLDGFYNTENLQSRATALADSVCRRMHIGTVVDSLGASIGGAMSPRHGRTEDDLTHAARQALAAALDAGSRYQLAH